jgi:hypothetical protein
LSGGIFPLGEGFAAEYFDYYPSIRLYQKLIRFFGVQELFLYSTIMA